MKTKLFEVFVMGTPKPQPRARSAKGLIGVYNPSTADGWKTMIVAQLKPFIPGRPIKQAVSLDLDFFFRRPKSHYGTGKNSELLKASAPVYFTNHYDTDNLAKVVMDVMPQIGILYDDAFVVDGRTTKSWGEPSGVNIRLELMP